MHALKSGSGVEFLLFWRTGFMRLPRLYRGFFRRLSVENVRIPRHAGSVAVVFFLMIAAVFGMFSGGHAIRVFTIAVSAVGFGIEKIHITGNSHTSEIDVLEALGLDGRTSTVGFDVEKARAAIAAFPWISSVSVRKIYPDQLDVAIVERQPVAVWQHDDVVDIIDGEGQVITPYTPSLGHGLPLLVGQGAARHGTAFLEEMKPFVPVRERARAYIRVADRRWDILLDNGLRIRLPQEGAPERLAEVMELDRNSGLFSRDIRSIDLRLDDRIFVSLPDEALARYVATVRKRERQAGIQKTGIRKAGGI